MLESDGPINAIVGVVVPDFHVDWLGISPLAIYLVAVIEAWKYFGFITLIYLAGLAGVPAALKEAALIDGANARQVFRHVKLPLLLPAMTVTFVLPLVGALNAFEVILATTRGGPGTATSTLNIVMFQQFGNGLLSFSTASVFVVTMLVFATAIPLIWLLRRRQVDL
jgi:multiple sugar transport system permease protein/raffinose/stachyose/melibiose transport system permease protein